MQFFPNHIYYHIQIEKISKQSAEYYASFKFSRTQLTNTFTSFRLYTHQLYV